MKYILMIMLVLCPALASAKQGNINFTASLETGFFVRNGNQTDNTNHENGQYPFVGSIGLEYELNNELSLYNDYIHKSKRELSGCESWWSDRVMFRARFNDCLIIV